MPACSSLSDSSTDTLVLQTQLMGSALVYRLCCVFTLLSLGMGRFTNLGTVLKTEIGSYRFVPRTDGYIKKPRYVVCCVVWVCVDTCCDVLTTHNHITHSYC